MLNIYKNDTITYKVWNKVEAREFTTYASAEVYALSQKLTTWVDIHVSNKCEWNYSAFSSTVVIVRQGMVEDIHACYKKIVYKDSSF